MSGQHAHSGHKGAHGSYKSYTLGFVISLILTIGSFGIVMKGWLPPHLLPLGIVVLCVAQLLVQLGFFLHMGMSPEQRDNVLVGIFTVLIIAIAVGGSVWVMHNANELMIHPATTQAAPVDVG